MFKVFILINFKFNISALKIMAGQWSLTMVTVFVTAKKLH